MSLDIGVRATREVEIFDRNITYNLSKMYYKCIPGGFRALDGMSCKEALPILQKAIEDLIVNQEEYEKLNPENGWGTYYDLLKAIKAMRNCCEDNPDGIIDVC
jgi:hypothetical protein